MKDIATNQALRTHVVEWLRANDINPDNIPHDAYVSLVDDQLTTDEYVLGEDGRRQWQPGFDRCARTTKTYPVTLQPPADVAEWLRSRCTARGR